jgi:uncharacterized protein (TIGR03067 family)
MRSLLALIILGSSTFAAPIPKEIQARNRVIEQLRGKWLSESGQDIEGKALENGNANAYRVLFDGSQLTTQYMSGEILIDVGFVCDIGQNPMTIDIEPCFGGKPRRGIFKFEGAKLFLCHVGGSDVPRPSEFKGGNGQEFLVLKKRIDK